MNAQIQTIYANNVQATERLKIPVGTDKYGYGGANTTIDTLTFALGVGTNEHFNVIHVSGDIFAVVYQDTGNLGILKTFSIDKAGAIGAATIASFTFEATACYFPSIIQIYGTTYAVAYSDDGGAVGLQVKTITINPNGTLGAAAIDSLVLDSGLCYESHMILASDGIVAVCYRGPDWDGWLKTVSVDSAGSIGAAAIDSLEFAPTGNIAGPTMVHVSGNIFAIFYRNQTNGMTTDTVDIDSAGNIGAAVVDTEIINAGAVALVMRFWILKISGTTYAVAYSDNLSDGWIKTFSITSAGTIGAVIGSLEFDTDFGVDIGFTGIAKSIYAVAYRGTDNDGFLKTMKISEDGTIGSVLSTLEFDTTSADSCDVVRVPDSEDIVVIVYGDNNGYGVALTVAAPVSAAGYTWIEGKGLNYFDVDGNEQIAGVASRTFHVNAFHFPDPISEWRPTLNGAYLPASLTAKKCWLPLNFLKAGDIITAYNLVGDAIETNALTLDCKLVQVNKADPLTTTDITSGAITQIIANGNFDQAVNPDDTTVATDKQYLLELLGTTGVADEIYVMGAEVTITRL